MLLRPVQSQRVGNPHSAFIQNDLRGVDAAPPRTIITSWNPSSAFIQNDLGGRGVLLHALGELRTLCRSAPRIRGVENPHSARSIQRVKRRFTDCNNVAPPFPHIGYSPTSPIYITTV
jgi:hypothetical protein